jgi:cytosine/adenosine deaminase-related metal-dependent hydrolase
MSCSVVSDAHIHALIATAIYGPKDAQEHVRRGLWRVWFRPESNYARLEYADKIGQMLLGENLKSYGFNYPGATDPEDDAKTAAFYRFHPSAQPLTRIQALKAIFCLEYQSDGPEEWAALDAANFLQSLRLQIIESMPGYEEAAYSIG